MSALHKSGRARVGLVMGSLLGVLTLVAACSGGDDASATSEGSCSDVLCMAGPGECFGNAIWTCDGDGLGWSKQGCGTLESCVEGVCAARVCMTPAKAECSEDGTGGTTCSLDGMSETEFTCAEGESCHEGACVATACTDGETACGYRAVLTCDDGEWEVAACGASKLCVADGEGARCESWACTPGTSTCMEGNALTCDAEGRAETVTPCTDTEVCEGGYCVAATCAQIESGETGAQALSTADATGDDTAVTSGDTTSDAPADAGPEEVAPHPGLEPISRIDFKLSGIPNTFDLAAQADFQESESRMVISGSDGARKMEINLAKVEAFTVGSWSDTDDSEITAVVCYHDGTSNESPPDGAGCAVGFSHASILYSLEILTNNGDGSRVTGTFSATMMDALGGQLEFTEGSFDVLHK